jgi:hypothetical protein
LNNAELIWAYVEPIIQQIREKDFEAKLKVYMQLNTGQRALLMLQVLYGHMHNGIAQFYFSIAYLLEELDFWSELKTGLQYFNDIAMLRIIEMMEYRYHSEVFKQSNRSDCSGIFPKKSNNIASLEEIDALYNKTVPTTLKQISAYIRNNPANFA